MKAVRIFLLGIFITAALAYLNAIIPMQKSVAHSDVYPNTDSCGNNYFQVSVSDGGCGDFFKVGNDFSTSAAITNTSTQTINNIRLHWKTYWCANDGELTGANPSQGINAGSCLQRPRENQSETFSLRPGESKSLDSVVRSAGEEGFNMCGLYQTDFWFDYNDGACTSTRDGHNFGFAAVGYCHLWDGNTLASTNPWNPAWQCVHHAVTPTPTPTPTATATPTPTSAPTPTPTVPVTPTPSSSCYFSPVSLNLEKDAHGTTTLYYTTKNIPENNKQATVCLSVDNGNPTYLSDTAINFGRNPVPVDVTASHTYTAIVYLKDQSEDHKSCSGTPITACSAQTTLLTTGTPTPQPTTTQTIVVNVNQQQQQQQQLVLAASVAPAPTTSQLPRTGGDGLAVIATLLSLLPAGLKLRKLV